MVDEFSEYLFAHCMITLPMSHVEMPDLVDLIAWSERGLRELHEVDELHILNDNLSHLFNSEAHLRSQ